MGLSGSHRFATCNPAVRANRRCGERKRTCSTSQIENGAMIRQSREVDEQACRHLAPAPHEVVVAGCIFKHVLLEYLRIFAPLLSNYKASGVHISNHPNQVQNCCVSGLFFPCQANRKLQGAICDLAIDETTWSTFTVRVGDKRDA